MALRRGLGMNITSDMVKDYFSPSATSSLNPNKNSQEVIYEKYRVGSTSTATRAASGFATPHFSKEEVRYYEQQMTLSAEPDE